MLSINTQPQSENVMDSLWKWEQRREKASQQLASGSSINSAADNPAGLAMSMQMLGQETGAATAAENAQQGANMLQTADGGMGQIQDLLQQARTLSVQAGNGTLTASDHQAIQDQLDQITQQIDQISGQTQYNGQNLLDGTASNVTLQTGANPGQTTTVSLANMSSTSLGVNSLLATNATASLQSLDAAIGQVSTNRASVGASINGLAASVQVNQVSSINMAASRSQITDTNMAQAASQLAQSQILTSSGIAMLSQTSSMSSGLVSLIQA